LLINCTHISFETAKTSAHLQITECIITVYTLVDWIHTLNHVQCANTYGVLSFLIITGLYIKSHVHTVQKAVTQQMR